MERHEGLRLVVVGEFLDGQPLERNQQRRRGQESPSSTERRKALAWMPGRSSWGSILVTSTRRSGPRVVCCGTPVATTRWSTSRSAPGAEGGRRAEVDGDTEVVLDHEPSGVEVEGVQHRRDRA